MNVLINGAGIAGPTLAYWLARNGIRPTLVEAAPRLRAGGYIIDFWGAGFTVAERMGLLPELMRKGYILEELRLVDAAGRRTGGFDARVFERATDGRFVSLPRGALAETIYGKLGGDVETIFGDEIVSLAPNDSGVHAAFLHGPARDFDLVIGAGGLHSRVRALCFGDVDNFTDYLAYKVAAFEAPNYQPRDELVYVSYSTPGQQAARFSLRDGATLIFLVMADADAAVPPTAVEQRAYVHAHFDNSGWECAKMMAAMDACETLYFDNVSQIHLPKWSKGRVALIGDAAACPSLLAGEGASLAMAEAYVLAGELGRAGGDYRAAFANYEALLRPLLMRKQRAARGFAASFAPRTKLGISVRNLVTRAMAVPLIADLAFGRLVRDDFELPSYG